MRNKEQILYLGRRCEVIIFFISYTLFLFAQQKSVIIGRWHGKSVHNFRINKNNGNLILTFSSWLKSVGLLIAVAVDYLL